MRKRYRILASGYVQGVGFRFHARSVARSLGIGGWVRNREDGSVEIVAEAEDAVLRRFLKDIQEGRLGGNIRKLDVSVEETKNDETEFRIEQ